LEGCRGRLQTTLGTFARDPPGRRSRRFQAAAGGRLGLTLGRSRVTVPGTEPWTAAVAPKGNGLLCGRLPTAGPPRRLKRWGSRSLRWRPADRAAGDRTAPPRCRWSRPRSRRPGPRHGRGCTAFPRVDGSARLRGRSDLAAAAVASRPRYSGARSPARYQKNTLLIREKRGSTPTNRPRGGPRRRCPPHRSPDRPDRSDQRPWPGHGRRRPPSASKPPSRATLSGSDPGKVEPVNHPRSYDGGAEGWGPARSGCTGAVCGASEQQHRSLGGGRARARRHGK